MGRAVHASLPVVGLAWLIGIMSCREPTQITVRITTDAKCPTEPLTAPRLVDTTIASAVTLDPKSFVAATKTDRCEPGAHSADVDLRSNDVGTLVLLPSGDNPAVDVLVVAGVELAAPNSDIAPLRLSSEDCQLLIEADGVGAIGGKPCILARRRLGFVEHTKLELPMDLDTRCIGKKCGEDESCFKGNCVSIDVDCSGPSCAPQGCDEDCDAACPSGRGECQNSACQCLPCDTGTCGDSCALSQAVGACNDDVCICKTCDQAACTADCEGQCSPETGDCVCLSCDAGECAVTGPDCACQGSPTESCQCIVDDCMQATCAMQACEAGQLGECGVNGEGMDTCTCTCDDDTCDADCDFGGGCDENGACACNPPCMDSQCTSSSCAQGKVDKCYQGGCACVCENSECNADCVALSNPSGACTVPNAPQGDCVCNTGGTGGAPPNGGNGGDGGMSGTGGFGGQLSMGGGTVVITGGNGSGGGTGSAVCEAYQNCPAGPCLNCPGNMGIQCDTIQCGCAACSNIMAINCPGAKVWGPLGICECCGGI